MSFILTQDNSDLKQKTTFAFEQADHYYKIGQSVDDKEKCINFMIQGLNYLNLWITRQVPGQTKDMITSLYAKRYAELQERKQNIADMKKQKPMSIPNGGGGGGNGGNQEQSKQMKDEAQGAILKEKPNVKWSDISGLEQAKQALQEAVILPIKFPQLFQGARKPWRGILLYGPPGTGKTLLAKACATEADSCFIPLSCADIVSKFVGDSEKKIQQIFQVAREHKPAIIFIDEIDSIAGSRGQGENEASRRLKTEILTQMQGVGNDMDGILVLGATNLPWAIDSAIRRRFERRIYIPLPQTLARNGMLKSNLGKTPHTMRDQDFEQFAKKTQGYSGSDMSIVVRDASFEPIRQLQSATEFIEYYDEAQNKQLTPKPPGFTGTNQIIQINYLDLNPNELVLRPVEKRDFEKALSQTKPSVSQDQLKEYQVFTQSFGQDG